MTTRLPLSMLEGVVVTGMRVVPPTTRITYTDGTYLDVVRDGELAYSDKLTALEKLFNIHVNTPLPAAHNGVDDSNPIVTGPFAAILRVVPTPPSNIRMAANTVDHAISEVFKIELELRNNTSAEYTDIGFTMNAPHNLVFFDDTAVSTIPAYTTITGTHGASIQQRKGFRLRPGEAGTFSILAQQTFGAPIMTATVLQLLCADLEYRINNSALIDHPTLPLSASYNIAP